MKNEFRCGLKDGVPIALGYFSVSFSFGIMAVSGGLSIFQGALISLTNVTSAGQFAGLQIIVAAGTILEMIMTQFIINLRYALMSLSLSQKLSQDMTLWQRMVVAFANTDEIFAVAMGHAKSLSFPYMVGLELLPICGWVGGTICGATAFGMMPASLSSALNLALYGMFIAIVVPVAKKLRPVLLVVILTMVLSCLLYYVPVFSFVSSGMSIIICTVIASVVGAYLYPIEEGEHE